MSNTIKLFMWGYQHHMQSSLQIEAEQFFTRIDKNLNPKIFLLGVLIEDREDRHDICLEPEDCGYNIHTFTGLRQLAEELEKVDPEGQIFHTHPVAQEGHNKRISNKSFINAIKKVLERVDFDDQTDKHVSYPTYIEGFLVFTILEVQKEALSKYYSLTKEKFDNRFRIHRSLIESAIDVFLKESSNALKDPYRGFEAINRRPEEMLRESGKQFMYTVSHVGGNFEGLHGLYDACNTIASMRYEGAEGFGKLAIAHKDHMNLRLTLELESPIKASDYRKVRKFLELSTENSIIISDSALIYGLGELVGKYNPKTESLFIIDFISHFKWQVLHDDNPLMVVEYKLPNVTKERINRLKFYSDLPRIFKSIKKRQIDDLWDVTMQATQQKHGTMLVITSNAQNESIRLGKQSFPIKPMKLSPNIIQQITSIDGAVLLDKDSTCYSIGVILDGLATEKGDASRGSRYNSAVRYYEQFYKEHPMVIVIISEDGMINFIPQLKPQIKHSDIIDKIDGLKELNKLEKVERKKYYPILNWLENHRFYLRENECSEINKIRKELEQKEKDSSSVWIVRNNFIPNPEMNDSYYI
ncbi:DNA integrity scanning protein DisA nucleotide-binding domain protein [Muricauda sp. NFXS6]|uniref:diadenylate cyclase n=1 Tax=Allomuricauda sp. NFXS6 TaxID=2819094 RepID=UPI0032DFCF35